MAYRHVVRPLGAGTMAGTMVAGHARALSGHRARRAGPESPDRNREEMVVRTLRLVGLPLASFATMALLSGCADAVRPAEPESVIDTTPPPAPANLSLSYDATARPILIWEASTGPDVVGYLVYVYSPSPARDNAYVLTDDPNPSDNSFQLPSVTTDTEAVYRVRAFDVAGNRSAFSPAANIVITPTGSGGAGSRSGGGATDIR